jgi:hypothetical protein
LDHCAVNVSVLWSGDGNKRDTRPLISAPIPGTTLKIPTRLSKSASFKFSASSDDLAEDHPIHLLSSQGRTNKDGARSAAMPRVLPSHSVHSRLMASHRSNRPWTGPQFSASAPTLSFAVEHSEQSEDGHNSQVRTTYIFLHIHRRLTRLYYSGDDDSPPSLVIGP